MTHSNTHQNGPTTMTVIKKIDSSSATELSSTWITMNDSSQQLENSVTVCPNSFSVQVDCTPTCVPDNLTGWVINEATSYTLGAADTIVFDYGVFSSHTVDPYRGVFENCFPNWQDFELMKKQYPAIDNSFNRLKELYDLCKDDWQSLKNNK